MSMRTALVTGAAVGIGRAIALRLAREGLAVGVLDVDADGASRVAGEIEAAGGKGLALVASVADRGQVTAAVTKLRGAFGPVTVLVNNAGINHVVPFEQITDEQWESSELKLLVLSRHHDPRTGDVEYRLTNVSRAEPAPDFFTVPSDYTVVDSLSPRRRQQQ